MSQRKTLSKVPLTSQFTTNDLSYADVVKFDMSNQVHVWDHSYSQVYKVLRKTKIPAIDLELCKTKDTRTRQTNSELVQ